MWPPPLAAAAKLESSEKQAFIAEPRRRRHAERPRNPLIESKAAVNVDESEDEDDNKAYPTMESVIVGKDEFELFFFNKCVSLSPQYIYNRLLRLCIKPLII